MKNNKKFCLILTEYAVNKHFKVNIKKINQKKEESNKSKYSNC